MYFVLDLLCAAIVLGMAVRYWTHAVSHILLKCVCVAISVTVAVFAGAPIGQLVCDEWVAPYVEQKAAGELADMLSAPHGGSGRETMAAIAADVSDLVRSKPEPYLQWIRTYGADEQAAAMAYGAEKDGVALLETVTGEYSRTLSRGGAYLVVAIVCYLLTRLIARRLEWNMTEPKPRRGLRRVWPPLCGALYGLLLVMGLTLFLEWVIPAVSGNSMIWSTDMLTMGTIYPALKQINPFIWLYFS